MTTFILGWCSGFISAFAVSTGFALVLARVTRTDEMHEEQERRQLHDEDVARWNQRMPGKQWAERHRTH